MDLSSPDPANFDNADKMAGSGHLVGIGVRPIRPCAWSAIGSSSRSHPPIDMREDLSSAMISADPLRDGRTALSRGEWERAVMLLQDAVAGDADDAEAWEALATARVWVRQEGGAIEARERAYALYRERGDDLSSARVSLDLANDFLERGDQALANGWFQRSRRLLADLPPSREHALLRIWDAYLTLAGEEDGATAAAHAAEAVAIATAVGAHDAAVLGLALQGHARVSEGRVQEGMSLLDEAVAGAAAGEISDPQWFFLACCCMIDACDRVRDYGRSLEWCRHLREFSLRWRVQAFLTTCRVKSTAALLWRGAWAECESELQEAAAELAQSRPGSLPGVLARLAELRRRQGRLEDAEALLASCRAHPIASYVRAEIALGAGDASTALDLAQGILRRMPRVARTERVAALEIEARACSAVGRLEEARSAARELHEIAEVVGTRPVRAVALRVAGLISEAEGDLDAARQSFEDAAHLLESGESSYEAARVRLDLARCLGRMLRKSAALSEAAGALDVFEGLGAASDAAGARAVLEELEAAAPAQSATARRDPGTAAGLTRRQREVLVLVAQGLSDREIAGRLFLSEHTVHRHIANILTRLGLSSRSAAVARALREEML